MKEKGKEEKAKIHNTKLLDVKKVSLTELMTLEGMEEDVAVSIQEIIQEKELTTFEKLKKYATAPIEQIEQWSKSFIK